MICWIWLVFRGFHSAKQPRIDGGSCVARINPPSFFRSQDKEVILQNGPKEDIVQFLKRQYNKRGKWKRVYPDKETFQQYSKFQEAQTSLNLFAADILTKDDLN